MLEYYKLVAHVDGERWVLISCPECGTDYMGKEDEECVLCEGDEVSPIYVLDPKGVLASEMDIPGLRKEKLGGAIDKFKENKDE